MILKKTAREKATALAELLENQFTAEGTFWDQGNAAAGSDPNFTFKDFIRGLLTVPNMRWWMILGQCWNLITPKWPTQGLTEAYIPNRKYNFRYRSIFSDGIILESFARARKQFGLSPNPGFLTAAQAMLDSLAEEAYFDVLPNASPQNDPITLRLYSYYPRRGHRVPQHDPVYELFFKTEKNVPETDSTCTFYCTMRSFTDHFGLDSRSFPITSVELDPLVHFMVMHIRGAGRYGQGLPSYDPGVGDLSGAVAVWYKERFNEFEPFANINILHFCFYMYDRLGEKARLDVRTLAQSITEFLSRHAEKNSYTHSRFNFYYPLSIGFFLWWRCLQAYSILAPEVKAAFGLDNRLTTIDLAFQKLAQKLFEESPEKTNRFDRCVAAPYLYSRNIASTSLEQDIENGLRPDDPLFNLPHAFFRMWYPSKILSMPEKLAMAATLDLLTLVDKSADLSPNWSF